MPSARALNATRLLVDDGEKAFRSFGSLFFRLKPEPALLLKEGEQEDSGKWHPHFSPSAISFQGAILDRAEEF